jgi:transcriptional regulator of acetoin/glycerol metabolism
VITAEEFTGLPEPIGALVDAVVEVPPLRDRGDDVLPLAAHFAQAQRHRDVGFTRRAAEALTAFHWPQNVRQLRRVVQEAASRADVIDVRHLPPEIFGDGHRLSRLEVMERDEIVRALTEPGTTGARAAGELGMSRATLYRKIDRYGISVPKPAGQKTGPKVSQKTIPKPAAAKRRTVPESTRKATEE